MGRATDWTEQGIRQPDESLFDLISTEILGGGGASQIMLLPSVIESIRGI